MKMARPEIKTIQNLESAFAGESMAHIKYRYFAKLARAAGDIDTAEIFEATADQEVMHAFGHLDLLYPASSITPQRALEIAIEGEPTNTQKCTQTFVKQR
jgi:rubrerythrin